MLSRKLKEPTGILSHWSRVPNGLNNFFILQKLTVGGGNAGSVGNDFDKQHFLSLIAKDIRINARK